jgi:hypothetical protein
MKMPNLKSMTVSELFDIHGKVLSELRERGVVRSTNKPIADYAEYLSARALSLSTSPKSTKGYDAKGPDNKKYEIKSRQITRQNPSREVSALRDLDKRHFDYLIGVLFNEEFRVLRACRIPHSTVLKVAKYSNHTNAWRFHLRDSLWSMPGVVDLTAKIQKAEKASGMSH